jgi:hypothetical protein
VDFIVFQTVVDGEQIIRPPADVVLPQGVLEVTVRQVRGETAVPVSAREAANARLREHRVSLGRPTGTNNEGINADLGRAYGDNLNPS